jgi:hypothetical protein
MSTGKTNISSTQFAAKKLLGKAQTSNLKSDVNESVPSNVSMPSEGIFGEAIPNDPGVEFYTLYSASAGAPTTVEQVYFDIVSISDTIYDANVTGGGGDEASNSGAHGYYLKLPSNYESTSSNAAKGSGYYTNGQRVYTSRGGLQLVPPLISNASPNRYFLKLYKGDPTNPSNEITSGDSIDWQVDYYSGVVFVQDYNASSIPLTASAYLYTGKYLDDKLSTISSSGGTITALNNKAENRLVTLGATTTELDGEANLTFNGSILDLTGGMSASTYVSSSTYYGDGSNLSGISSYSRRSVTSTTTASISDTLLGVSASAALEIRLPGASVLTSGQYITIKDEGGNSDVNNITILTSGSETIDGGSSIVMESAYAAVTIYSNGTDKYFVY